MLRDLYEARRRRRIREEVGGLVISATLAALAGATAGVLLAPKSGKETREDLKETSREVALKAKSGAREIADEVYIRGLEAKQTAKETVEKIASKTEELKDEVTDKGLEVASDAANKASHLASTAEHKADELKDATEKLGDDLERKNREVESDIKKFGRDPKAEYEIKDAKKSGDLKYNVCESTDMECRVPGDDKKDKKKK